MTNDYTSGPTKFTVREAIQPCSVYQPLTSQKLLSGTVYSIAMDTCRWRESTLFTNISQISGTAGCTFSVEMQTSPYNDSNWFAMGSATVRNTTGTFHEKIPRIATALVGPWTRYKMTGLASGDGGIWVQVDAHFHR